MIAPGFPTKSICAVWTNEKIMRERLMPSRGFEPMTSGSAGCKKPRIQNHIFLTKTKNIFLAPVHKFKEKAKKKHIL